ncbi:hypothetical protein ACFLUU_09385 [Chloroflexota bacterium]
MDIKKPRVGLYGRVSSQEQALEGVSIEAQIADLKTYAQSRGWEMGISTNARGRLSTSATSFKICAFIPAFQFTTVQLKLAIINYRLQWNEKKGIFINLTFR